MVSRRTFLTSTLAFSSLPMLPQAQTLGSGNTTPTQPNASLGIILVGASWCPYCHGAAKDLHLATQQWGWPVLITTLDNTPIPPFEHFMDASQHPLTTQINRLPTTLIVDPQSDQILSVIEGFTSSTYLGKISSVMVEFQEALSHG